MRSDSYNFTHLFLRKIQSFEQDSICLIAQDQSHTYGELLDSIRNALNLLNSIKANSVIGIIGDYDLKTLAFFLACVEKGFIITPLSASLAPKDSIKTKTPTAEVSLGNFAGCVDIATRSYLNDNDAVAISNSLESAKKTTQKLGFYILFYASILYQRGADRLSFL